jgi:REP element-mobilizing transposase RayT
MPPFTMFQVSRDNPAYYLTSVTHHRLPIFQTDTVKQIICSAFDEARKSAGLMLFSYVIMPDHTHVITDNAREMKDVLRYLNGISAKRVIDYLKENGFEESLGKLRIEERANRHTHSFYEHHPNALRVTGEDAMMQKINYIHLNPVRAGMVEHPDDYGYSSSRQWHGRSIESEPLIMDHRPINGERRHSRRRGLDMAGKA